MGFHCLSMRGFQQAIAECVQVARWRLAIYKKSRKVIRNQRECGVFVIDAFVELDTASEFTRQA